MMFENSKIKGIHKSRYVASWCKAGGGYIDWRFFDWLGQIQIDGQYLTDDERYEIYSYGSNGKLELESQAMKCIKNNYTGI